MAFSEFYFGRTVWRIVRFGGLLLPLASFTPVLDAATLEWTGDGSDDNWSTKQNWDTGEAPTSGDSVILTQGPSILDRTLSLNNLTVGTTGQPQINAANGNLGVTGHLDWNDGRLAGSGTFTTSGTQNFANLVDFTDWNVILGGSGSAEGASFQFDEAFTISGELTLRDSVSLSGGTVPDDSSHLILTGTLDKHALLGLGIPAGADDSTFINALGFTHHGTLRATRGKLVVNATVNSDLSGTTEATADGEIIFRGGGQFGTSQPHLFKGDGAISMTGTGVTYEFGSVRSEVTDGVEIASTSFFGGELIAANGFTIPSWIIKTNVIGPLTLGGDGRIDWSRDKISSTLTLPETFGGTFGIVPGTTARELTAPMNVRGGTVLQTASLNLRDPDGGGASPAIDVSGTATWAVKAGTGVSGVGSASPSFALGYSGPGAAGPSLEARLADGGLATIGVPFSATGGTVSSGGQPGSTANARIVCDGGRLVLSKVDSLDEVEFVLGGKLPSEPVPPGPLTGRVEITGTADGGGQLSQISLSTGQGFSGGGELELKTPLTLTSTFYGANFGSQEEIPVSLRLSQGPFMLDGASFGLNALIVEETGSAPVTLRLPDTSLDDESSNVSVMNWVRGRMAGNSTFLNEEEGTIFFRGSATKRLGSSSLAVGGQLRNDGRLVFPDIGGLALEGNAYITNEFDSTIDFQGDADIGPSGTSPESRVRNFGTLLKSGGTGTTAITVPIVNTHIVEAQSGTLSFSKAAANFYKTTNTLYDGTWIVGDGAFIKLTEADRIETIASGTTVILEGSGNMVNGSNQSLFRSGANLTVNGDLKLRTGQGTQVDEVQVFSDLEDPENETIPGLAVAGDFTCDRLTCDGGQLTCEPTGTITCPEFNLANSICTVDGTITGGGPLLVFTVTGGSIDGNGLIQGDLQLVGDAVLSPGSSPGTLTVNTLTMGGGTTYTWEVSDFAGTEGVTTDLVENNGNLVLTGTVADPVTIRPVTLDAAGNPGLAANWDPAQAGQWLLVRNAGSISGFSPDTVVVDAGGVANPPFGGRFDVAVDGTDLVLRYTPSDFAIWQAAEFPDSADRAAGAAGDLASDPDRDRLPNLIEYALGTDPRGSGPFTPLLVELTGSGASRTATATFPRRATANDLHLILEVSDDLSPSGWSTLAESLRGAPATGEGGLVIGEFGTDPLTVTVDNIAAPESGPGQYFRLLAEQRPLLPPGP